MKNGIFVLVFLASALTRIFLLGSAPERLVKSLGQDLTCAVFSDQNYEKEKNNKMMIGILSQIVEFRNSESGMHVRNISTLTGMLLEKIIQKTDKYYLSFLLEM